MKFVYTKGLPLQKKTIQKPKGILSSKIDFRSSIDLQGALGHFGEQAAGNAVIPDPVGGRHGARSSRRGHQAVGEVVRRGRGEFARLRDASARRRVAGTTALRANARELFLARRLYFS